MKSETLNSFLFSWIVAFVVFESLFNTFAWHSMNVKFPRFQTLKTYYHEMPTPIVVFGDLSYSTMIFLNTLFLYNKLFNATPLFSTMDSKLKFVLLMIGTQILYDLCYYCLVTYTTLYKTNDYFHFFKKYAKEFSYRAIFADSIYLILWFSTFIFVMNNFPMLLQYYVIALGVFLTVIFSYEDL